MSLTVSLVLKLRSLERSIGSIMPVRKIRENTRRMNRLEELGRVDAEKAFTKKGARNLRDEKKRIVRELKAKGGKVKEDPMRDRMKQPLKTKGLKPVKPSQKG